MRLTLKEQSECGIFCPGWQNGMGCFVRGDKNSMRCYVRGDKNSMGCFVWGGKSLWDVLSGVAKNGMECFVPGCFSRLPIHVKSTTAIQILRITYVSFGNTYNS